MKIDDIINRKELSDRLDKDMELFKELSELFIEDSQVLLNNLDEAIVSGDSNQFKKAAHTIKGSISNFSALKAFDAALALENIGKNNQMELAEEAFNVLKKEIDNLKEAMNLLMKEDNL